MKWIVAHGDMDGICSAAIAMAALGEGRLFFSHPTGLAEDLAHMNGDVVVLDIAISRRYGSIIDALRRIGRVIYIDHHPLPTDFDAGSFPGEFIHSTEASVSELTYCRFAEMLPHDMSRVAIYGAIGDYLDWTVNIRQLLGRWDKRTLYLESGLLVQAIESGGRNYDYKRSIVKLLQGNVTPSSDASLVRRAISEAILEEEMRKRIKENVRVIGNVAYVLDIGWALGKSAIYARAEASALIGIGAETRKGFIDMSVRTESGFDLNVNLAVLGERLGGSGGGHPKAAGARVPVERFEEFIRELDSTVNAFLRGNAVDY